LELKDLAKNEITQLLKAQRPNGFIPNSIFDQARLSPIGRINLERHFFLNPHKSSNYSQPPLEAQALEQINDPEFTRQVFDKVLKGYLYFIENQDLDEDGLVSFFHPHESGRDADPTFDILRRKLLPFVPGRLTNYHLYNMLTGLYLCRQYRKIGWDIRKIWHLNLFNVEDVMFNCLWVDGMRALEKLALEVGARLEIKRLADKTESSIYRLMWQEKEQMFYALDNQNQPIKTETISNLFPLILPNIPKEMADTLLKRLLNPEKFWLPFPIPSVAADNPAFNPNYPKNLTVFKGISRILTLPGIWRGPTCMATNWLIINGLILQAKRFAANEYLEVAKQIIQTSKEMVKTGFYEFYNPLTGEGERVKNYGWATLVATFEKMIDS